MRSKYESYWIGRNVKTWFDGTPWDQAVANAAWAVNEPKMFNDFAYINKQTGTWKSEIDTFAGVYSEYRTLCKFRRISVTTLEPITNKPTTTAQLTTTPPPPTTITTNPTTTYKTSTFKLTTTVKPKTTPRTDGKEVCPAGDNWEQGPDFCYYFTTSVVRIQPGGLAAADAQCKATNRRLGITSIATIAEQNFLKNIMSSRYESYWIGRNVKTWFDGTPWDQAVANAAWAVNEPRNFNDFAYINKQTGTWKSEIDTFAGVYSEYRTLCKFKRISVTTLEPITNKPTTTAQLTTTPPPPTTITTNPTTTYKTSTFKLTTTVKPKTTPRTDGKEVCPAGDNWEQGPDFCYYFTTSVVRIRPRGLADVQCKATNSRLGIISIATIAEQNFLKNIMSKKDYPYWIGSYTNTWFDGTFWDPAVANVAWALNEPRVFNDFAYISRHTGAWKSEIDSFAGVYSEYRTLCKFRRLVVITTDPTLTTTSRLSTIPGLSTTMGVEPTTTLSPTTTPEPTTTPKPTTTTLRPTTTPRPNTTQKPTTTPKLTTTPRPTTALRSTTLSQPVLTTIGESLHSCECRLMLEVTKNCTNNTSFSCVETSLIYEFPDTSLVVTSGCQGCLEMFRVCPEDCFTTAISFWGTGGLSHTIIEDTPWGPRSKTLGQLFCERHFDNIPSPGGTIVSSYKMAECEIESRQNVFNQKLCCVMYEVPIAGFVPVWDYNCNGIIENDEASIV
ncbi:unnamed protein product [Owenia fusiformis]|uniref:Uncharacterized protein n=1 Tax=Owenia fusiformis TaxID=6347 RepID=A0A8J1Y7T1_OWEFU|nr:unnamed protein product [Owenia fusiformis]